ncbi:MAG: hypothetical protein L3J76_06135 [Candidatus Hydrothermae bacterium]|nr:hypothetical protein [Candidatus Hydrothermae bacterium]
MREDSTGSVFLRAELDRLEWSLHLPFLFFTLGRQPVSLGRSHLLGVMDVFAPFPPFALDADVKPGVDALRGRLILCDNLESTVLVHNRSNMVIQGTEYGTAGTLDLLAGRLRDRPWAAVAWEGTWRETAGWMESMLVGGYGQVALGVEHHLPRTRLSVEGIVQHPDPQTRPDTVQRWFQEGLRRLPCTRCGMLYVEHKWHPMVRTGLGTLFSADDRSAAIMLQIFLDWSDTQDMGLWYFEGIPSSVTDPGSVGGTGRWIGLYSRWSW